jgi:hypothetical protein
MKTRSLLLALIVGFVTAFSFAADQAAPALPEELAAKVRSAAQSGDTRAIAQAVADNPSLATQIASVATAANPASAGVIAATVAAIVPAQAAQVAAAVTVVAPTQAGVIAASVATIAPSQAASIAASVSAAAPSQSGAVTAAVVAVVPASSAEIISMVATATHTSNESVQASSTTEGNVRAGNAAASQAGSNAQTAVTIVSTITPSGPSPVLTNPEPQETPSTAVDPTIGVSPAGNTL